MIHHSSSVVIANAARAANAGVIRLRFCALNVMICGGLVMFRLQAFCADFAPGTEDSSAAPLNRSLKKKELPGRREAANQVLGFKTVNHPADPKLKPLRFTERRIFIASSRPCAGNFCLRHRQAFLFQCPVTVYGRLCALVPWHSVVKAELREGLFLRA